MTGDNILFSIFILRAPTDEHSHFIGQKEYKKWLKIECIYNQNIKICTENAGNNSSRGCKTDCVKIC